MFVVLLAVGASFLWSPMSGRAQDSPNLVAAALDHGIASVGGSTPAIVCVSVRPWQAEGVRDVSRDEASESLRERTRIVGGSECDERTAGTVHRASGAEALIVRIGVDGLPATGRAHVTWNWFRSRRDAGASRCAFSRSRTGWQVESCEPLGSVR